MNEKNKTNEESLKVEAKSYMPVKVKARLAIIAEKSELSLSETIWRSALSGNADLCNDLISHFADFYSEATTIKSYLAIIENRLSEIGHELSEIKDSIPDSDQALNTLIHDIQFELKKLPHTRGWISRRTQTWLY